jgi:hypothetical protein
MRTLEHKRQLNPLELEAQIYTHGLLQVSETILKTRETLEHGPCTGGLRQVSGYCNEMRVQKLMPKPLGDHMYDFFDLKVRRDTLHISLLIALSAT